MSSHAMAIRGTVHMKPGVTLPLLMSRLDEFLDEHGIYLEAGAELPMFGEVPFDNRDDEMCLDQGGALFVNFNFWGPGGEYAGDDAENVVRVLDALVDKPGWVLCIDHDSSPTNSEANVTHFVGPTPEAKRSARIEYALSLAREWLEPCVSPQALEQIWRIAHESVLARSAA